jgi:hypothetical protein
MPEYHTEVTVLTPELIDEWVYSYEAEHKLPQKKSPAQGVTAH